VQTRACFARVSFGAPRRGDLSFFALSRARALRALPAAPGEFLLKILNFLKIAPRTRFLCAFCAFFGVFTGL
jgi:hypothetical protein